MIGYGLQPVSGVQPYCYDSGNVYEPSKKLWQILGDV